MINKITGYLLHEKNTTSDLFSNTLKYRLSTLHSNLKIIKCFQPYT